MKLRIGGLYKLNCGAIVLITDRNQDWPLYFKCQIRNPDMIPTNMGRHYGDEDWAYWRDKMLRGVAWYHEDGMVDCREEGHPLNVVSEIEP